MRNNRLRILYVITQADHGGAQSHVHHLLESFHERYDIHLAVGNNGPLVKSACTLHVNVHILPSLKRTINAFSDIKAIFECRSLIQVLRPNLIHAHSSKAGIVTRIAAASLGIPVLFTAHGWAFTPGTPVLRRVIALFTELLTAPLATYIICVSEFDRQIALRHKVARDRQLKIIRHGLPNIPTLQAQPDKQPPRLIMVARFNKQKDQPTLLRAIAALKHAIIHVDFFGTGPNLENTRNLAITLGIDKQVTFWGDRTDVAERLADYQAFVLSTHYEGLPISILEAMRAGLPIIASHVSGIPEEVINGETGILIPPRDPASLAAAIEQLFASPNLRTRMGAAARQKFLTEFTLESMVTETEKLYHQVIR